MASENDEVKYEGFVTPCFVLEGSNKSDVDKGKIIDPYAKTAEQDGLICGFWSIGFEDKLVHLQLTKPVPAFCDERERWVAKSMLLKEPINYMEGVAYPLGGHKVVKRQPVADAETGVVQW